MFSLKWRLSDRHSKTPFSQCFKVGKIKVFASQTLPWEGKKNKKIYRFRVIVDCGKLASSRRQQIFHTKTQSLNFLSLGM